MTQNQLESLIVSITCVRFAATFLHLRNVYKYLKVILKLEIYMQLLIMIQFLSTATATAANGIIYSAFFPNFIRTTQMNCKCYTVWYMLIFFLVTYEIHLFPTNIHDCWQHVILKIWSCHNYNFVVTGGNTCFYNNNLSLTLTECTLQLGVYTPKPLCCHSHRSVHSNHTPNIIGVH